MRKTMTHFTFQELVNRNSDDAEKPQAPDLEIITAMKDNSIDARIVHDPSETELCSFYAEYYDGKVVLRAWPHGGDEDEPIEVILIEDPAAAIEHAKEELVLERVYMPAQTDVVRIKGVNDVEFILLDPVTGYVMSQPGSQFCNVSLHNAKYMRGERPGICHWRIDDPIWLAQCEKCLNWMRVQFGVEPELCAECKENP